MKGTISPLLRRIMLKDPHLRSLRRAMDEYYARGRAEDVSFEVDGEHFVIPARGKPRTPPRKRNWIQVLFGL